jgi:hypothetical protein
MSKTKDTLLSLTLLGLVFTGPAAVAAYLLSGDRAEAPLVLAAAGDGESVTVTKTPSPGGNKSAASVLAGVLYTAGTAQVDWNGEKIPVTNGSYAYFGNEVVSTGPGDMGLLQLDGDNRVYMCPGSRMSVAHAGDGAYDINIFQGGGRFAFAPGTNYRIAANRGVYSPSAGSASQSTVVEIAVFKDHPGGVACGFSGSLDVAGYSSDGIGGPIALGTAGPGEIIDLSRALRDEAASADTPVVMQPIPMSASVQKSLRDNAPYPREPGPIGYLCRCLELKRYAEADGIPDAAIVPRMLPPDSKALVSLTSDSEPPVLPPIVLAVPGAPDALSTPAPTTLTVPPPLIPVTGSGGGFTSTPS